jgi:5'/3'-nucleotidase SurE
VTLGLRKVMPEAPDLILSGVNRGANLGDDVTYSGTVSAALEGSLAGIRSIALSQVYSKEGVGDAVSFDAAEKWGEKVLRPLIDAPFAPRTLINVNFPRSAPTMSKASASCVRASTIMPAVRWSKAPIRAAIPISGLACTALNTRWATTPIWKRLPMASFRSRRSISI